MLTSRTHAFKPAPSVISVALLLAFCFLNLQETIAESGTIDIGSRKQLFIDKKFITEDQGITLRMNPPVKKGKVVDTEYSWEKGLISGGCAVFEDNGRYRLFYSAMPASHDDIDDVEMRVCYAESKDGIHWEKPALGLITWQGSSANNILIENNVRFGSVFKDPSAPAAERYKLVARLRKKSESKPNGTAPDGDGLYVLTSPGGFKWNLIPKNLFPFNSDTVNMAFYDESKGKYLAYVRTWRPMRRVGVIEMDDITKPWPYDKSVPRFRELWGPETVTPPSREVHDAFGVDDEDYKDIDHYTPSAVKYPWAEDVYFLFPSPYLHFPEPPEGEFRNDGPLDIQVAVSRDGLNFEYASRRPYVELGVKGSPDSGALYMIIGMIRHENVIRQYYAGYDYTHGAYRGFPETKDRGGLFMVEQRLDGFVSADADHRGGSFVTPPLKFEGKRLVLNMNASATGMILVELRDSKGNPFDGYSFEDCDPLHLNDLAKTVTWSKGEHDVSELAGETVQVAFRMRSAKLYAFQFSP